MYSFTSKVGTEPLKTEQEIITVCKWEPPFNWSIYSAIHKANGRWTVRYPGGGGVKAKGSIYGYVPFQGNSTRQTSERPGSREPLALWIALLIVSKSKYCRGSNKCGEYFMLYSFMQFTLPHFEELPIPLYRWMQSSSEKCLWRSHQLVWILL